MSFSGVHEANRRFLTGSTGCCVTGPAGVPLPAGCLVKPLVIACRLVASHRWSLVVVSMVVMSLVVVRRG
jgi:hypothetical protein